MHFSHQKYHIKQPQRVHGNPSDYQHTIRKQRGDARKNHENHRLKHEKSICTTVSDLQRLMAYIGRNDHVSHYRPQEKESQKGGGDRSDPEDTWKSGKEPWMEQSEIIRHQTERQQHRQSSDISLMRKVHAGLDIDEFLRPEESPDQTWHDTDDLAQAGDSYHHGGDYQVFVDRAVSPPAGDIRSLAAALSGE